ncbi:TPA: hypothetical protein ACKQHR_001532 [Pseudomonas aeruginosa]
MPTTTAELVTSGSERLSTMSRQLHGLPLQLYWVGDSDVYAARSAEEAYEIHIGLWGEEERKGLSPSDVSLVDEISLDSPNRYESGKPASSLRQAWSQMKNPGPVDLG